VLQKAFANIAGSNPYDGVFAGIIIGGTIKEFCADYSLLQRVYSTLYGLFHDMTQKLSATVTTPKRFPAEHILQMALKRF
jgi:hypothetical protein